LKNHYYPKINNILNSDFKNFRIGITRNKELLWFTDITRPNHEVIYNIVNDEYFLKNKITNKIEKINISDFEYNNHNNHNNNNTNNNHHNTNNNKNINHNNTNNNNHHNTNNNNHYNTNNNKNINHNNKNKIEKTYINNFDYNNDENFCKSCLIRCSIS
jgi:hypothetical protein